MSTLPEPTSLGPARHRWVDTDAGLGELLDLLTGKAETAIDTEFRAS